MGPVLKQQAQLVMCYMQHMAACLQQEALSIPFLHSRPSTCLRLLPILDTGQAKVAVGFKGPL